MVAVLEVLVAPTSRRGGRVATVWWSCGGGVVAVAHQYWLRHRGTAEGRPGAGAPSSNAVARHYIVQIQDRARHVVQPGDRKIAKTVRQRSVSSSCEKYGYYNI